jgi:HK97 family phage major capsid protein
MNKFVKFNADCGEFKKGDVVEMDEKTAETLCKAGIAAETEKPDTDDVEGKIEKALANRDEKLINAVTKAMNNEVKVKNYAVPKDDSDLSMGDFLVCVGKTSANRTGEERTKANNKLREGYKVVMSEGTNSAGGYTVPMEYAKDLLFVPGYDGAIYPDHITPKPMGHLSLTIPALDQTATPTGSTSAFYGGVTIGIVAEGVAPGANTQPAFKQVVLTAKKALATTVISNELLDDSILSVESLIKDTFRNAATWFINWSIFNGAGGASALAGIIGNAATIKSHRQTAVQVQLQDLAKMYAKLAPQSRKNAVWFINPLVWAQLVMLGSAGGAAAHFVWLGNDAQGNVGNRLFGLEVVPTEALPTLGTPGDVVLADGRYYALGMRTDVTIDASPHYLFPADQITYRLKWRMDGAPQITAPIILNDGVDTVSPFVQLDIVGS